MPNIIGGLQTMRFASFEYDGKLTWGLVITNPEDNRDWVYEPWKLEYAFKRITNRTNGYFGCLPQFWPDNNWPKSVKEFLETGDVGIDRLKKLEIFLMRYIEQSDPYFVSCVGHPVDEVTLRVPVPDTKLFLGLVQNSPSFFRTNPNRTHVNVLPQAHQRSIVSVAAHKGVFYGRPGGNVEVGIVIGKECYNVPIEKAYEYVVGYTVVFDSESGAYYRNYDTSYLEKYGDYPTARRMLMEDHPDWYVDATGSWIGKGADGYCGCGPYITTKDEIGNPYDLVVMTLANGCQRDVSNTAGYLIGIERTVSYFSQFMTLHPGDIIHLGTVGTDGVGVDLDYMKFEEGGSIGAYIEKCGTLAINVVAPDCGIDTRTPAEKERPIIPAAQDLIDKGETEVDHFDIDKVRCMWTCFGNFETVEQEMGWKPTRSSSRMLNGPCGQLTDKSGTDLYVAPIATELELACEMAFVIRKLGKEITKENAREYILGLAPVISVCDMSIYNGIVEPATKQEAGIGLDYGRWGDGYQTIGEVKDVALAGRKMTLTVEGVGTIECSTDEYLVDEKRTLEYLSCATTMLPGDVVTLGRLGKTIRLPVGSYEQGVKVTLKVDGFDEISRTLYPFSAKK